MFSGWLLSGLFVQRLSKLLQTGHNLWRFGQDGGGEFLRVIRPSLGHFGKRHHYGKGIIYRVLDLAELLLQLGQFLQGNGPLGFAH